MRRLLPLLVVLTVVASAYAQEPRNTPNLRHDSADPDAATMAPRLFPPNPDGSAEILSSPDDYDVPAMTEHPATTDAYRHAIMAGGNLTYHGGDVINVAKVVCIFWGPTWASGGSDNGKPGPRKDYGDNYYAAFVIDPDGYRLEAYTAGK